MAFLEYADQPFESFFILDTGSMTFTPREIMTKNTTDNNAVINEQREHSPREYTYITELSSINEGLSWKKHWKDCNSQNTGIGYSI